MPLPEGAGPMFDSIREIQINHDRMIWSISDLPDEEQALGEQLAARYKRKALAGDINGAERVAHEFRSLLVKCGSC